MIAQINTVEQGVTEVLEVLNVANDFGYFCDHYAHIQDKRLRQPIPFKRYDCQIEVSEILQRGQWVIVLKARQLGLTWTTAVYCTWQLITKNMFQACVLQQNREYARDFVRRVRYVYKYLPDFLKVRITNDSRYQISFDHGPGDESELRVIAGGEASGRSLTADLIVMDEHAYIPNNKMAREGCEPTLEMSAGQIILISTSAGPYGDFYDVWQESPSNGYQNIFLPWDAHPQRDDEWYEAELAKHAGNPLFVAREYPSTPEEAFMRAEGRCFPQFSVDEHVRTLGEVELDEEQGVRFRGIDFGHVQPFVCVWISYFEDEEPGLTVDPSCVNVIREFLAYRFADSAKLLRDKPLKVDDHTCDAIRYVIMAFEMTGHVHVYRELYVDNSVGKGRTDLQDIEEIHELSGWVRADKGKDRCYFKPGGEAEHFVGTVADRSLGKSIELYCLQDLPCMPYAKPKNCPSDSEVLQGVDRINLLIDGTREIMRNFRRRPEGQDRCVSRFGRRIQGSLQHAEKRYLKRGRKDESRQRRAKESMTQRYQVTKP